MKPVIIYTKSFCPYSVRAKELLGSKGVDYVEYDIAKQPELRPQMIEKSHGGTTVPQVFIDGKHIGGSDELAALDRAGKLDALLA